jgi:3-hydroxyacyl-CoA dehydrogenase
MTNPTTLETDGDVAIIVIDNPPINAGSLAVRRGVIEAIEKVAARPEIKAAVLIGAGKTFIAGSDLREFGAPIERPSLPEVIATIEACDKPVVAAIHGAALGGGLELALGCDARIATRDATVGLPEVTLGIIPGAGGTQRLPRLIGVARAIGLVATGERVRSEAAHALGIIDAVADGDLRTAAVNYARGMNGHKRRVRDMPVAQEDAASIESAAATALKRGKGRPAVRAAIEAVRSSITLPIDQALAAERSAFEQLRTSREALALRHQFFAERDSAKHPELSGVEPRCTKTIAVIGAGTMGSGIAIAALDADFEVLLLEVDKDALARGENRIEEHYAGRVKSGKLLESKATQRQSRLTPTTDWELLSAADLIIEAVFEDLGVKKDLFRRVDSFARPGAVLASNTSYLDLDAIADATDHPSDVVGLHFFSPANVMRLVEVVRARSTAPDVLVTALTVAKRLGKLPVLTKNAFGFIGNRIYAAYRRQCEFMLEEGALPEQIDAALEAFGFAMGPFAVADMSGLDIAWRMRKSQAASRDPNARYVDIPDRLCELGRFGRKTGSGYYIYSPDKKSPTPDPFVRQVVEQSSAERGITRRALTSDEIQRRALLAMVNEATLLLGEGVARRPSDVDVVLVNGYGFPRWEGGPVFWATQQATRELDEALDWLGRLSGPGFVRGDAKFLTQSPESSH